MQHVSQLHSIVDLADGRQRSGEPTMLRDFGTKFRKRKERYRAEIPKYNARVARQKSGNVTLT